MEDLYKGDLFKKLQEIKEWQAKQQEKLLSQQKEQQEALMRQHKKTMEMFGLRKNLEKKPIPFKEYPFDPVFDDSIGKADSVTSNERENEKEAYFSDVDKENFAGNVTLDDVPVNPVKVDFKELLEEKLKKDDPGIVLIGGKNSTTDPKPKRKFLKKGEGLKRFYKKPDGATSKRCLTRERKPSPSSVTSANSASQKKPSTESRHSTVTGNGKGSGLQDGGGSASSDSATWANVLTHQKKPEVGNERQGAEKKPVGEYKKNKYEGVDLQVFELLEQMAGDSSFCSTSSTLLGFMEAPVISTPLKAILEKKEQPSKNSKQLPFGLDTSGEDSDDSKGDFDSSSDSCYSEAHRAASAVTPKSATQSVARVRFSSHVEEREFDPGIEDSSVQESPNTTNEQFGDTEAWSDDESNSGSDDDHTIVLKESESSNLKDKQADVVLNTPAPQSMTEITGATPPDLDGSHGNDQQVKQDPTVVFKSELLRQKMLELEHEIEKFRRENEKLNNMKRQHEISHAQWSKEKRETEKKLQEKEEILKSTVLEERKKFNREKQVFERYCKELRNLPSKQEREEIQTLQQKLSAMQQEMRQKESRNAAAQARITTRLKTLEGENLQLKQEIEKLKKEKLLEARKYQCRLNSKPNTKFLHAINNQICSLQNLDREQCLTIRDVVPTKPIPQSLLLEEAKAGGKQQPNRNKTGKATIQRSRTVGTSQGPASKRIVGPSSSLRRINSVPNLIQKGKLSVDAVSAKDQVGEDDDVDNNDYCKKDTEDDAQMIHEKRSDGVFDPGNVRLSANVAEGESMKPKSSPDFAARTLKNYNETSEKGIETLDKSLLEIVCDSLYPKELPTSQTTSSRRDLNQPAPVKVYPLEKINSDGSREIRFENGNFKHISPDGKSAKLYFYNGDVKETLADGTVKYYYSETRTWHTTLADGLEILEFPNGQVERHCNGTTEVSFPDGTVRLIHPNGKEEVMLVDGTVATIEPNGDQLIQLPNGQKEYQTKEYKKRVYPDGTVKIVYSDGVQETRYANGRIRLRDADGNLVMDQNPDGDDS